MKETRVAIRYAKALFDLCIEQNLLERVDEDMHLIEKLYDESREFRHFLKSPVISNQKKNSVFKALLESSVHSLTLSFTKLMVDNNRESVIAAVAKEFHSHYKLHKGIVTVELLTSEKMSDILRTDIIDLIEKETGKKVELLEKVNSNIIGGFVIQLEDKQFDASIITKIKRLSREFNINVYEKGY